MDMNAINIKVDPGDSAAKLKLVTDALVATETRGKAAGASMLGIAGSFKTLGAAIEQHQAALARTGQVHDQLTAKNSALVGSFHGLGEQLAREKSVLDEIRAPQQRYFDTLTALDKLLDRNAISTKEYADQVTKLNQASGAVKLPEHVEGGGKELLGQVGGAVGGAAGGLLGSLAEGGAMGFAIEGVHSLIDAFGEMGAEARRNAEELVQMKDRLTELRNETQKYVDSGHTSADVLDEQSRLAHDLHSNLQSTIGVYDAVREGSDELNLSHADQIRLTRTLGEDLLNNNRSLDQAGGLMERLAYAMKAGGLSAMDFTSLAKQVPGVVKEWEEHFHLSQNALKEAVASGKIGIQQLLDVTISGGQGIDSEWQKHIRTVGQYRDELKEAYETEVAQSGDNSMVGKYNAIQKALSDAGAEGVNNAERLKDAQALLGEAMAGPAGQMQIMELRTKLLSGEFGEWTDNVHVLRGEFDRFGDSILKLTHREQDAVQSGTHGLIAGILGVAKGATSTVTNVDELAKHLGIIDPWKVATDAAKKYRDQLGDVRHVLDGLIDAANHIPKPSGTNHAEAIATGQADYLNSIGPTLTSQQQAAELYRKELGQLLQMQTDLGLSDEQVKLKLESLNAAYMKNIGATDEAVVHGKEMQSLVDGIKKPLYDYQHGIELTTEALHNNAISAEEAKRHIAALQQAYDSTQKHSTDFATGLKEGWNDIVKEATDSGAHIKAAMTGAFSAVEDSIASMVMKGQFDLNSLGSALEQILVKLAVQQAVGGLVSAIGPIGGGMNGFDYMTGSGGGPALPGFATGGDMMVGGAGAPDSKLAMFRVTPGESIHVRTPEQRDAAGRASSSGGGSHTIVNLNYDPKAIASGKAISDGVMNTLRQNRSAIRALLGI